MAPQRKAWAEIMDDDEFGPSPGQQETGGATGIETQVKPDGTKVVTETFVREGERYRSVRTYRTVRKEHKVFPAAEARRQRWKKFGKALEQADADLVVLGTETTLELGKVEELNEKRLDRAVEKKIDQLVMQVRHKDPTAAPGNQQNDGLYRAKAIATDTADSRPQRDDSCTVRVTNLSDEISEEDLRALFNRFGSVMRCYVGKDKLTHERKGYAFISFREKSAAEMAIAKLHRHPLNHVILNVTWAQQPGTQQGGK
eukprot:Hpha_TRINITY_DN12042_c0_g3::TRINITY_DN12042_c0_g3_i1::g.141234::m.141234/K03248/EIF3G; translation initiation factor 3 subunit G